MGSDGLKKNNLQSIFKASIIFISSRLGLTTGCPDQIIQIEQYEGLHELLIRRRELEVIYLMHVYNDGADLSDLMLERNIGVSTFPAKLILLVS